MSSSTAFRVQAFAGGSLRLEGMEAGIHTVTLRDLRGVAMASNSTTGTGWRPGVPAGIYELDVDGRSSAAQKVVVLP